VPYNPQTWTDGSSSTPLSAARLTVIENGVAAMTTTAEGAVAKSVVTTKGDLLAASGGAVVTRQGVGADLTSLGADSAAASGVRWHKRIPLALTFTEEGVATTGARTLRAAVPTGEPWLWEATEVTVSTAPTGTALIVDVLYNGSSIYTTGNRPTVAAGTNAAQGGTPTTTAFTGGYFTINIAQVGSTVPGSDLNVTLFLQRALTVTAPPPPPPPPPPVTGTLFSGVVQLGSGSIANADDFGTWRGRAADLIGVYSSNQNAWVIDNPNGAVTFSGSAYAGSKMVFSLGMLRGDDATTTLQAGATGAYDSHWTACATALIANGHGNAICRIGWEPNLPSTAWTFNASGARNGGVERTSEYATYWRRIVNAMRAVTGANFKFAYSMSNGSLNSLVQPELGYPGDNYVDIVMNDAYDAWYNHPDTTVGGTTTLSDRWNQILTGGNGKGLTFWRQFCLAGATRNNNTGTGTTTATKKLAFGWGEWGLWNADAVDGTGVNRGGGGDDPGYMDLMRAFINETLGMGVDVYETYANYDASDGNHQIRPAGATAYPNGAARYQALF
jgi:hypothetical protein